ncbi:MAG: hypothetical protein FWD18_11460 [Micrococcales bacterium]|nr:hypothetical protein [Micrococcales bacterium]
MSAPVPQPPAKAKKPLLKRWWFWVVAVVLVIIVSNAASSGDREASDNSASSPQSTAEGGQAAEEPGAAEPAPGRDNSGAVATTLGTGSFLVGSDVQPGRYVITPGGGESGNLQVSSASDPLKVNEILGTAYGLGVPSVTVDLVADDEIKISGLSSVTFTPAETSLSNQLSAGQWIVGLDIAAGRYVVTPAEGESGNFFVYSDRGFPKVNEILGGDFGVPSVTVSLEDGQRIKISSLSSVVFEPR